MNATIGFKVQYSSPDLLRAKCTEIHPDIIGRCREDGALIQRNISYFAKFSCIIPYAGKINGEIYQRDYCIHRIINKLFQIVDKIITPHIIRNRVHLTFRWQVKMYKPSIRRPFVGQAVRLHGVSPSPPVFVSCSKSSEKSVISENSGRHSHGYHLKSDV